MGITYYEKERLFKLDTPASTYMCAVVDEENFLGHVYFGPRLEDHDAVYLIFRQRRGERRSFLPFQFFEE